jgi:osmotically-inducible protein OsmY
MAWFNRLFGGDKKEAEAVAAAPAAEAGAEVAPERVGPDGNYDQSGLAKRVAMAFDQDGMVADIETVWVAQTGSNVVLKGKVPSDEHLARLVEIATNVNGASNVDTQQVEVG